MASCSNSKDRDSSGPADPDDGESESGSRDVIPGTDPDDEQLVGACGGAQASADIGAGPSGSVGGSGEIQSQDGLELFTVVPLPWCPHLDTVQRLPEAGLDTMAPCQSCDNVGENWICLVCYKVYCSRYVNEDMLMHSVESDHKMVLSYADLSVWCYACDSYVHNKILLPMKRAAHRHKFGEDIPGHS